MVDIKKDVHTMSNACVDAHRVKVLHVTHRDAVVVLVAHHFILQLLPPLPRQDVGRLAPGELM
jgi:hypothetical protein